MILLGITDMKAILGKGANHYSEVSPNNIHIFGQGTTEEMTDLYEKLLDKANEDVSQLQRELDPILEKIYLENTMILRCHKVFIIDGVILKEFVSDRWKEITQDI